MSAQSLEAAVAGRGGSEATVLRGTRPPALDGPALRAATTPLMAAFMVAAALLRTRMEPFPLDPMGLALRTLALAFTLRAALDLVRLVTGVVRDGSAAGHALAWDAQGLLLSTPTGSTYVPREDVAAIVTPPARLPGEAKRKARPLWLVLWPGSGVGRGWLTVPPYFARDADVLQARLERWLGEPAPPSAGDADDAQSPPAPDTLSWTARRAPGFWKRAPLGWALLGFTCLDALRVAPPEWREALRVPLSAMTLLTVLAPALWILWMERRTRTPSRLLLALSRRHAIAIGRRGSVALDWQDISAVQLSARARWSPFEGGHAVRVLEIHAHDGSLLRFDASLLDAPLDAVAAIATRLGDVEPDAG